MQGAHAFCNAPVTRNLQVTITSVRLRYKGCVSGWLGGGAALAVICVPWLVKVDMERNTTCKLLTREKVSGRHMGREKKT